MTGNADLLTAFWINVLTVVVLLTLFVIFKSQRSNSRVYFPRWFVIGQEDRVNEFVNFGEEKQDGKARSCVNLNWRTYFHSMDWMWSTRRMSEAELIKLVGLDYVAFLRSLLLGYLLFWLHLNHLQMKLLTDDNFVISFHNEKQYRAQKEEPVDTIFVSDLKKKLFMLSGYGVLRNRHNLPKQANF